MDKIDKVDGVDFVDLMDGVEPYGFAAGAGGIVNKIKKQKLKSKNMEAFFFIGGLRAPPTDWMPDQVRDDKAECTGKVGLIGRVRRFGQVFSLIIVYWRLIIFHYVARCAGWGRGEEFHFPRIALRSIRGYIITPAARA